MRIPRRDFLSAIAAGAAITLPSVSSTPWDMCRSWSQRESSCAIFDLESRCLLRESLQGYQDGLAGKHLLFSAAEMDTAHCCRTAIVPGLGTIDSSLALGLMDLLDGGTNIILESGATFLSAPEYTWHEEMLNRYFGITIGPPVHLWPATAADRSVFPHHPGRDPGREAHGLVPYVNYVWPCETRVRDFSWVIPISAPAADVIGTVGAMSVAIKKRARKATLIFLGSPLGPSLRAGDPEARSWLRLVTSL